MKPAVLISIILCVVLGGIYFSLFSSASKGYGYAGYNGYSSGPSFFYFGGPSIYTGNNRSIRSGSGGRSIGNNRSFSSSNFRGGGPSGGK